MRIIYGKRTVFEALSSGELVRKIYIQRGTSGNLKENIKKIISKKQIEISEVSSSELQKITDVSNNQGIAAEIGEVRFTGLDEIINLSKKSEYPLLLLLDSIQDPRNLGALFRTAESAGVDGVVITTHNSAPITNVVEKTAAGAVAYLKICRINNMVNAISQLKKEGFWIVGAVLDTQLSVYELNFSQPTAVIFGNEEKGLRRLVSEKCDFLAKIPMFGSIQSLNVSVSAGIFLYEILRQNKSLSINNK